MREYDEGMGRGSGCYRPFTEIRDLEIGFQVLVKGVRKQRWNKARSLNASRDPSFSVSLLYSQGEVQIKTREVPEKRVAELGLTTSQPERGQQQGASVEETKAGSQRQEIGTTSFLWSFESLPG